jgi:hypothetical protein
MSRYTCPLCGLRYPAQSLLDLHIREDHAPRAAPAASAAPADTPAPPPPPPPPGTERPSWAKSAWRVLNRMLGREPAERPRRAA